MARFPVATLVEIFGENIPATALELCNTADESVSDQQLLSTMMMMRDIKNDPRVVRALAIAKTIYADTGKTFEQTYSQEDGGSILAVLAKIFVEVFRDLDAKKPETIGQGSGLTAQFVHEGH